MAWLIRPLILSICGGFGGGFFLEFVGQGSGHESDAGQLLADAVVQIVADAALLAVADFQNFPFQPLAFGDVARDDFHLDVGAGLLDQAGADFQPHPLRRRR